VFTHTAYVPHVTASSDPPSRLSRSLGLRSAVVVGVSAMIGTGVFAVWQPALQRAGGLLILAVVIAAAVAGLNATSTARLAARNPEAGGVYAYGRIHVNRFAGVLAGLVFIIGKTASASAAALTIGLYVWPENSRVVALVAVGLVLALNLRGVVRSTRVAAVMVIVVALVLLGFVLGSGLELADADVVTSVILVEPTPLALLAASGLIFVAFAGYARITVLGEEVTDPRRTIPLAIAWSFGLVLLVYLLVAVVVVLAAERGATIGLAALNDIAQALLPDWTVAVLAIAAVLAAGAVLVSLIAGVGRTLFAMADRGDAPRALAAVGRTRRIPYRAEIAAAVGTAVLVVVGGLTVALAISGSMILTYYAIGHWAALRLPREGALGALVGRVVPVAGLVGCAALVLALILAG